LAHAAPNVRGGALRGPVADDGIVEPLAAGLHEPATLREGTLLQVAHAPDDWPRWLEAASVTWPASSGLRFEFYGQALQASADGLGVAMGIRPYIDVDIAAGRLIAPFTLWTSSACPPSAPGLWRSARVTSQAGDG